MRFSQRAVTLTNGSQVELNTQYLPTLRSGRRGPVVSALQRFLACVPRRGGTTRVVNHISIDERFGPETASAVRAYQTDRALSVDGVVGPQTWGAMSQEGACWDDFVRAAVADSTLSRAVTQSSEGTGEVQRATNIVRVDADGGRRASGDNNGNGGGGRLALPDLNYGAPGLVAQYTNGVHEWDQHSQGAQCSVSTPTNMLPYIRRLGLG